MQVCQFLLSQNKNKKMITLSQNKKIVIASMGIFFISFSSLIFFLEQGKNAGEHGQTNVLHAPSSSSEETSSAEEKPYLESIDELKTPFFIIDEEGTILHISDKFERLLNMGTEAEGEKIFDYINSKDIASLASVHAKTIHDGKSKEGIGPYRMLKSEDELLLLFNITPVLDKAEKVSYLIFEAKDLTQQVEELIENDWVDHLYPQLKKIKDNEARLVVEKNNI